MWRRNALGTTILLTVLATALALGDRWSSSDVAEPRNLALRINPNTATASDLMLLPGIGPKLAEEIIAYRERNGGARAFHSETDLDAVKRIGPKTIERLRPYLTFDAPSGEETSP